MDQPRLDAMPYEILWAICNELWLLSQKPRTLDIETAVTNQLPELDKQYYSHAYNSRSSRYETMYSHRSGMRRTIMKHAHQALYDFRLTCKKCYQVARPFSYKSVEMDPGFYPLLKLFQDRYSCDNVVELRIYMYDGGYEGLYQMLYKYMSCEDSRYIAHWDSLDGFTRLMLAFEVVLMKMGHLERLQLSHKPAEQLNKYSILPSISRGAFLPKLTELTYDCTNIEWDDVNDLSYLYNFLDKTQLTTLHIRHLKVDCFENLPQVLPAFTTVYSLRLSSCNLAERTFHELSRSFPALEKLTYIYSDLDGGTPTKSSQCLLSARELSLVLQSYFPKLRYLEIMMASMWCHESRKELSDLKEEDTIATLAGFTLLEHLMIDQSDLTPIRRSDNATLPRNVFLDKLPSTLKILTITCITDSVLSELETLPEYVVSGKLKYLTQLNLVRHYNGCRNQYIQHCHDVLIERFKGSQMKVNIVFWEDI